jgi:tetratricopeptide (TPR) repeat protein
MGSGLVRNTCAYALLLALPVWHGGCKKHWLDAKTDKNLAVPSTLSDFQGLLDNTEVMNTYSCGIGEIGSDGHSVKPSAWRNQSDQERNAYTWTHDRPVISSPDWNAPYKRIAYCNLVLEGLERLHPDNAGDQQWYNTLKGGALFQRGRTFFELAQVFSPPYTSPLAAGRWGIPLRLTSDVNEPSIRSTISETYTRVISDLMAAKDLLPEKAAYKTRASKPAALAQLARVYLAMELYDSAYAYADSSLRLNDGLLDYNRDTLPLVNEYRIPRFNNEVLFHATLVNWSIITKDAMVDSSLYALYDSTDLRRGLFFKNSPPVEFKGSYYGGALLFSGLATDEMYLIRAECSARRGDAMAAMAAMRDVDSLLKKRYRTGCFIPPVVAGAKEALAIVLQERRKELLFRGLRWIDLRRLNNDPAYMQYITRVTDDGSYTLTPGSYRYTFPIPDDIIQVTGMEQNPHW